MAKRFYEKDGNLALLKGKTVAIIGYGSQGHAHALNLRDSGVNVVVGLYPGSKSWAKAEAAGLHVMTTAEAAKAADIDHDPGFRSRARRSVQNRHRAAPDRRQDADVRARLLHSLRDHHAAADVDVSMIAPKAPGHRVRELFTEGVGVPGAGRDSSERFGQSARAGAGLCARARLPASAGVIETTFKEETESDLFGEQAVLCGGVSELIRAGFETLVDAGYAPEIAYFECLHELKLIVDLIYEGGLSYMRYSVSDTAEYGDYTRGPRVVTDQTRAEMKKILSEIQSGEFAREWIAENKSGRKKFLADAREQPEPEDRKRRRGAAQDDDRSSRRRKRGSAASLRTQPAAIAP